MLAAMLRVLSDPVPVIPRGDIPADLQTALLRAMSKAPDDRWPTAADMGRSLQAVEADSGWPVTPLPVEEVSDRRPPADLEPAVPDGELTTPGLRGGTPADRLYTGPGVEPPAVVTGEHPSTLAPTSDEETGRWARRSPVPAAPCAPSGPLGRRRWWLAALAAVGGLAIIGTVVGLLVTAGSTGHRAGPNTPRLQPPSTALAARLAPRQVEVIDEQPSTVTIHWVDPSNGLYPFVVKVSNGVVQTATSHTQTVVAGLDPTRGYCFVVGAVYGVGGQVANGPPVCVRGGKP
jgi:hypothetical protein